MNFECFHRCVDKFNALSSCELVFICSHLYLSGFLIKTNEIHSYTKFYKIWQPMRPLTKHVTRAANKQQARVLR